MYGLMIDNNLKYLASFKDKKKNTQTVKDLIPNKWFHIDRLENTF